MAYIWIILQYKFDSSITTDHAGFKKKKKNEMPNFCYWFFSKATALVASMEVMPLHELYSQYTGTIVNMTFQNTF